MSENRRFRLPVWLMVSLLFNALLIGLIIGGGIGKARTGGESRGIGGGERDIVIGIENTLSDDDRVAFRQAIRTAFSESRDARRELLGARVALGHALKTDPYDQVEVESAFERLRAADEAVKIRLHDVLAEQMGNLTAEQREAIMRGLGERQRPNRNGREWREGRGEPRRPPPPE